MDELMRRLASGPDTFIHSLDAARDLLLVVELSEAELRAASFLDQRVLTPQTSGRWLPFADIRQRLDPSARDDAHYIFHIGHVGSTLISRLLGEAPGILSLREPLLLREIDAVIARCEAPDGPWSRAMLAERIPIVRRLLARTFARGQRAIVKATSFTSEIAPHLLAEGAKALLLYVTPASYITTILAGDHSRAELASLTLRRLPRLDSRLGGCDHRLWSLREGEQIAIGWMTEMLSLRAAADAWRADTALWMDFDAFLERPEASLTNIVGHFGLSWPDGDLAGVVAGPIMGRYSKAPEHGYSSAMRRNLQRVAASRHQEELIAGLAFIETMAARHPAIARLGPQMRNEPTVAA